MLSKAARRALNQDDLFISPIVILEIDLLREIGRVYQSGEHMVTDLGKRIGLELADTHLNDVIPAASALSWTKDPFDRIIVGEASFRSAPLVTKDALIHDHYEYVVW